MKQNNYSELYKINIIENMIILNFIIFQMIKNLIKD